MATCVGVSTDSEFISQLNEKIPETEREYLQLASYTRMLFGVSIPKELEMLEVQHLGTRKGKTYIVIWLWCKAQKLSRQLCKWAESDRLIKLLDILMIFVWSRSTEHVQGLLRGRPSDTYAAYTLQFLKTLSLKTMQYQRAVGK